jgi:hypothetical protein
MKSGRLLILVVALALPLLAIAAPQRVSFPESFIGIPYSIARARLAGMGWGPAHEPVADLLEWAKRIQGLYPELDGCAVDKPVCSFSFLNKAGDCLRLITKGESIEGLVVDSIAHDCRR